MNSKFEIRRCRRDDFEDVLVLLRQLWPDKELNRPGLKKSIRLRVSFRLESLSLRRRWRKGHWFRIADDQKQSVAGGETRSY